MQNSQAPLSKPLLAFTGLYMVAAIAAAAVQRNREFVMYIVIMAVLIAAVAFVHKRIQISNGALWGLSLWGLLHMAGGLVPVPEAWTSEGAQNVLYSWWLIPGKLKYDHVVHAFGFGLTTWICWQGYSAILRAKTGTQARATFGLCVLCAAAGMGFGALNEVIEFVATLLIPDTNVGGYVNTGWDLVSNLTGCTVAATWVWLTHRHVNEG